MRPTFKHSRVWFALAGIGLLAAPAVWWRQRELAEGHAAAVETTRKDLWMFSFCLDYYRRTTGRYPDTDEGLQALTRPLMETREGRHPFLNGVPLDVWGHPFVYHCPGREDPAGYDLHSLGPDGVPSADDQHARPRPRPTPDD